MYKITQYLQLISEGNKVALRCHTSTAVSRYLSEITKQRASSTHFVEYKPVLQIYSCQYTE